MTESCDLCDVCRIMNKNTRQYTWTHAELTTDYRGSITLVIIQYFKYCKIFPVGFSDHKLVICGCFIKFADVRSAYWHYNTALNDDAQFREVSEHFWSGFRDTQCEYASVQQW